MAQLRVTEKFYEKTRSPQEIKEGIFIVTKQALAFFPPVGTTFSLEVGEKKVETNIYSLSCTCRGPHKPHYHYFLDIAQIRELLPADSKAILTIFKIAEGRYHLSVN